jgi:hypothetical protein
LILLQIREEMKRLGGGIYAGAECDFMDTISPRIELELEATRALDFDLL